MASVQFKGGKCHGAGEAKAMMRHACADERVRHKHSNADIDTARTAGNSDLHGLSYAQMCDIYDRRVSAYQQASSRAMRKDAVTLYDAIISVPQGLPDDVADGWFGDVESIINKHYSAPVVLDIKIHRDEVHSYIDPDTGKEVMSRPHGHCFMFPEVDGRLCAKEFSSRDNMTRLNREIDAMTREKYHCAFLTGQKAKDRLFQTVEQLKRASDEDAQRKRVMGLKVDSLVFNNEISKKRSRVRKLDKAIGERERALESIKNKEFLERDVLEGVQGRIKAAKSRETIINTLDFRDFLRECNLGWEFEQWVASKSSRGTIYKSEAVYMPSSDYVRDDDYER